MPKLINTIPDITTKDVISKFSKGEFRHIVKTRLGMTCCDARDFDNPRMLANPEMILAGYKKGALQAVEFRPEGSTIWLTVFSRTGKKVKLIDEAIMKDLTVGLVNSTFSNTNLMNMSQYKAVNAKTWADKAFIMNKNKVKETVAF